MLAATRRRIGGNRGLGPLLLAQLPADFADWLDFVAVTALLTFTWSAPTHAYAWLAVGLGLPYLTVGLFAGALVDRLDLNRVLIWSNIGRAVATAALILAPNWQVLVAIIFARGCADAFFSPAKQAALQARTMEADLVFANGLSHSINQSSKIAAPALGGAMLAFLDPQGVFAFNAAVSVLAGMVLSRLDPFERPGAARTPRPILYDIAEGMRLVRQSPVLRAAITLMALGFFAMFFYDTLIAPLIEALGQDATALGLCLAALGTGGVLGGLLLGGTRGTSDAFSTVAAGNLASALILGGIGLAEIAGWIAPLPLLLALFALAGVVSALALVPYRALIQSGAGAGGVGRVSALSEAANMAALLIAPFLGAALAEAVSVGAAFVAGAAITLVIALAALGLALRFRAR
ncbi:putative MFS family arabinose efflux permease [Limimaricola soesokkakensis]|uniref:Putative MFS family arabinose efflux permease n=1 Tax=Limimaricola soesokkakensis TaxID=1343159 RepID=A0A1X6YJR8_9RHOB|nr:MFS transporter [Limimaricola soesokkakensis]PSK88542.1 putative MFS family arabinose efflux permease [Limimaricola soesokkakensis]SLN23394.1 Putative bacilysin exporter BacE [Limimaricola soesokkakensis]